MIKDIGYVDIDYTFNQSSGTLTITGPSTIPLINYHWSEKHGRYITDAKFGEDSVADKIKHVVIGSLVNEVQGRLLYGLFNLLDVKFEAGSNLTYWGGENLVNCESLQSIQFPESLKYLGAYQFVKTNSIKNIDIPSAVSYIGQFSFFDSKNIESINLGKEVLQQYTYAEFYAFVNLSKIKEIYFYNSDTVLYDDSTTVDVRAKLGVVTNSQYVASFPEILAHDYAIKYKRDYEELQGSGRPYKLVYFDPRYIVDIDGSLLSNMN